MIPFGCYVVKRNYTESMLLQWQWPTQNMLLGKEVRSLSSNWFLDKPQFAESLQEVVHTHNNNLFKEWAGVSPKTVFALPSRIGSSNPFFFSRAHSLDASWLVGDSQPDRIPALARSTCPAATSGRERVSRRCGGRWW